MFGGLLHSGMKRTFIWPKVKKLEVLNTVQIVADRVVSTIMHLFHSRLHH